MSIPQLDLRGVAALGNAAPDPEAPKDVPPVPREMSFRVRYVHPQGKRFEGTVVSRILDKDERLKVPRIAARLAGGVPFDHLPGLDKARIEALAMLAVQLREVPEWVNQYVGEDDALLGHLARVCVDHSARYFRADSGASQEDAAAARVAVDPVDPS